MPAAEDENAKHRAVMVIAAVMRFARRSADLAARFLRRLGAELNVPTPESVPAGFALGLGAALRPYLSDDLPPTEDLILDLFRRLRASPANLIPEEAGMPLVQQVLSAWLERCAIHAPAEVGADVAIAGEPDDALLEELADFLWRNRHLTSIEGDNR